MDFGIQMLIAFFLTCVIGLPIYIYKYKQFRKEGKSIKYLEFKVVIAIGIPITSIPVLLSDMSPLWKIIAIISMLLSGIAYGYSLTSARKSIRNILGLSPEDEDTGEVIKEEDKKKNQQ